VNQGYFFRVKITITETDANELYNS